MSREEAIITLSLIFLDYAVGAISFQTG